LWDCLLQGSGIFTQDVEPERIPFANTPFEDLLSSLYYQEKLMVAWSLKTLVVTGTKILKPGQSWAVGGAHKMTWKPLILYCHAMV